MATVASEIQQCEDRIRELQVSAERIRFDLAVEEAVLKRLRALSNGSSSNGTVPAKVPGSIASRIEEAMLTAGGPMSVTAITEALEKAGVTTRSESGLQPSVASALSRRKDLFVNTGKGAYDLVSRQKGRDSHEDQHEQHG